MALTVKKVGKLLRQGKPGRWLDDGGIRGLYLVVANQRAAHWELRFQINGRGRWMGLGSARTFSLLEARERAKRERQKISDKIDPLMVRRSERAAQQAAALKAKSFKDCAEAFIRENNAGWRNAKHGAQWAATLATYVYPLIGNLPVAEIDTPIVLSVLRQDIDGDTFWNARPETASRVRGRIESILGWATVNGYRSGENPARWKNHLDKALPRRGKVAAVDHHAALPYSRVPAFMAALRQRQGMAARALEFCILVAGRTGEVIGAKVGEIDFSNKIWIVPAGRMKAGKEHRVALAPPAIELLQALPIEDGNDFVFIGPQAGRGLSNMSMTAVLRRMGHGDVTVHGFRSSFRDWCAERTGYPSEVAEMALAHRVSDKTEAAYRRGDLLAKRHRLAADWAKYCTSPPVQGEGIIAMRRGA